jgi:hypothetical protein
MTQGEAQLMNTLIEATRLEFEDKTAEVEARAERGRGTGICVDDRKLNDVTRTASRCPRLRKLSTRWLEPNGCTPGRVRSGSRAMAVHGHAFWPLQRSGNIREVNGDSVLGLSYESCFVYWTTRS